MMKKLLVSAAAFGFLAGCAPTGHQDLEQFTAEVQQTAKPGISPPPELPELERIQYTGADIRNPFQPTPLRDNAAQASGQNCPQPTLGTPKGNLQGVALDQLALSGTMRSGDGQLVALVVSNEGKLFRVQRGDFIGLDNGRITAITPQQISIREWLATGDGCWQQRDVSLTLLNSQRSSN
ncbi:pilus assembly protein PilP [Pseudidiomarina marina]|uniref:Pilus assembly protein PilP n=1 Tax=Pseudidiomarina marina TaxID=502366 RepID=A0A432YDY6_9GAMM|nr:pilus assembly protein PilP [Pseudidiomarina marina]PHR64102.1 MAG: pilus assembly protein PilP [Idiomarina sp.]RUO59151.1 pilus assembly protein PilP [Pseudidiomarina marina]